MVQTNLTRVLRKMYQPQRVWCRLSTEMSMTEEAAADTDPSAGMSVKEGMVTEAGMDMGMTEGAGMGCRQARRR